jgi:hypothetical protein
MNSLFSRENTAQRIASAALVTAMSVTALTGCELTARTEASCDTSHLRHINDGDLGEQTFWGYAHLIAPKADGDQQQMIAAELATLNHTNAGNVELGQPLVMPRPGDCKA